jgi:hypothetical protein
VEESQKHFQLKFHLKKREKGERSEAFFILQNLIHLQAIQQQLSKFYTTIHLVVVLARDVAEFSSRLSIEAAARGFKTALFWFHFHTKVFSVSEEIFQP